MFKKKKLLIGGLILCAAIGYLLYISLGSSVAYYSTVSELVTKGDSVYGEKVRVNGDVVSGSVETDPGSLMLEFTIADEQKSLPVSYQGMVPDAFQEGIEVVVEGKLDTDGVFRADTILTKCPSKYEPQE